MIPETGSRNELKRIVIAMYTTPVVGDVYRWTVSCIDEFWRVVDVSGYSSLKHVHYETYVSYFKETCYPKSQDSMDIFDWRNALATGKLKFFDSKLPPVVDTHD